MTDQVLAALAGPDTGRAGLLRAHAAFAAIKEATLAATAMPGSPAADGPGGGLDPADRAEILAAALRALRP
jgi:hypothetical protein